MAYEDDRGRRAPERRRSSRHLIQDDSEGEQIVRASSSSARACSGDMYATVPTAVPALVRIECCKGSVGSEATVGHQFGQAEVHDLGITAPCHEDIRRLDVAMHDGFRVSGVKGIGDVSMFRGALQAGHEPLCSDHVLEGSSFQQLHHDEPPLLVFSEIIHGADVGMVQRRGGTLLALEAIEGPESS